ncbi:MAG TPA: hypothetical protein VJT73_14240 [Polyangiaceae bacterium]|nr:hypothetical protein [Polyangiaceae bacterium]
MTAQKRAWLGVLAVFLGLPLPVRADDAGRAREAREAIMSLDVKKAHALLDDASGEDPLIALERARLAIYEGNYDSAAAMLSKSELSRTDAGAELLGIATGSARATAGCVTEVDVERGVSLRLQDESDRPLAPFLIEVAASARDSLARDLKVFLPRPLRIELVRDLFTLAAMTGLPESAAQNTGTVAVAKWGRVTMISPRAISRGYPWADTLTHEMAHLAQTQASGDRAPLWLQEGVAKREETRWRPSRSFDDFPAADAVAASGLDKGLGRPIDKLGASIALLPTAEQAMVAFAEVTSFVRFWIASTGDNALPELLVRLRTSTGAVPSNTAADGAAPSNAADGAAPDAGVPNTDDYVDQAMKGVTGVSLSEWNLKWLRYLATVKRDLPPGMGPGADFPHDAEVRRGLALGELLRRRSHPAAAEKVLAPAQKYAPFDPLLRHRLASVLFALGRPEEAEKLISRTEDVHSEFGPWLALHSRWLTEKGQTEAAEAASQVGLQHSPLDPEVACQEKLPPELPNQSTWAPLCQAARSVLQD